MATIDENTFQISLWVTESLTFAASLLFLFSFIRLKQKNYSLYMILILCLCDLFQVAINFIIAYCDLSDTLADYLVALQFSVNEFGLCWSTALAVLVSIVLTRKKEPNPAVYTIITTFGCLIMATIPFVLIVKQALGITIFNYGGGKVGIMYPTKDIWHRIGYFLIYDVLERCVPLFLTCLCYKRVFKSLKNRSENSRRASNARPLRVLAYLIIQIICFFPGVVGDFYFMLIQDEQYESVVAFLVKTSHDFWGFLNLLAYWFLRPPPEPKTSVEDLNDMSLTMISNL